MMALSRIALLTLLYCIALLPALQIVHQHLFPGSTMVEKDGPQSEQASSEVPVLVLPTVQTYDWGKLGEDSLVARYHASVSNATIFPNKPYAEVSQPSGSIPPPSMFSLFGSCGLVPIQMVPRRSDYLMGPRKPWRHISTNTTL
jgi:hypothetical protein